MQIVDDHTIRFQHSNRLMTIEGAQDLANNSHALYQQAVIGYLKPNAQFKEPANFPSLQKILHSGRLTDATYYYELEWNDKGITFWLSLGSQLLRFATYNGNNNDALYQRFSQLPDSTTAFVDPQTMAIFLVNEDGLASASLPDQRENYLNKQRQSPINQYFYSNLPTAHQLNSQMKEGQFAYVPIDPDYQALLGNQNQQVVFDRCSQDAAFHLVSVSGTPSDFYDDVSPVSDNVRLSLFVGVNYSDSQEVDLKDNSQVQVHNLDGRSFHLKALRFVCDAKQHNRIFLITDQDQSFPIGQTLSANTFVPERQPTTTNLLPKLLHDGLNHWTCLYFPQQKWTRRDDGQEKIEFDDYIFFFRH